MVVQNNDDSAEPVSPSLARVISDAGLAVVAGSDTTSGTLSNIFYFLMRNPDVYRKLREEVDLYYPAGEDPCDSKHYSKMVYMDAVM